MIGTVNEKGISTTFNVAKVLAILSVILAHSRIDDMKLLSAFAERLGSIGVITFLIISGYFYNLPKYGFLLFFRNKIQSIFIAWLTLGSLVFFVCSKDLSFYGWANWIIGNGTYLYYLTILISCFLIFAFVYNYQKIIYFSILLNLISLIITSCYSEYLPLFINNYLNPFNWIGFFALGILLKKYIFPFITFLMNNRLVIILPYLMFVFISLFLEDEYGYFSKFGFINELLGTVAIFAISTLKILNSSFVASLSKYTFSVYLIHFLIFPIRKIIIVNELTQFINPIIYFFVAVLLIKLGLLIANKMKLEKYYQIVMGLR